MVLVLNQQVLNKKLRVCLIWFFHKELVHACKEIAVTLTWQSSGLLSWAAEICLVASLGNAGNPSRLAHLLGTGWGLHPTSAPQSCPWVVWKQHGCQPRHARTSSCTCVLVLFNFSHVDNTYYNSHVCKCVKAHHISNVKVAVGSTMLPLGHVPSVFSARKSLTNLQYEPLKSHPKTGQ